MTSYSVMPSPVGPLMLCWTDDALSGVGFDTPPPYGATRDDRRLRLVRGQLEQYFAGERRDFDLPLAFAGTPFQERVWRALTRLPYGTTTSYGELARRIGKASWSAARAVGGANGKNPIAIVVPCHRVVGADGSLTGFGGGLPRKRWLLEHERARQSESKNDHVARGASDQRLWPMPPTSQ